MNVDGTVIGSSVSQGLTHPQAGRRQHLLHVDVIHRQHLRPHRHPEVDDVIYCAVRHQIDAALTRVLNEIS